MCTLFMKKNKSIKQGHMKKHSGKYSYNKYLQNTLSKAVDWGT